MKQYSIEHKGAHYTFKIKNISIKDKEITFDVETEIPIDTTIEIENEIIEKLRDEIKKDFPASLVDFED